MKITLTNLKKIYRLEELNSLDMGKAFYDIGHRGGHLGFRGVDVANRLGINPLLLPISFGVYCNYLGGGVRGVLVVSDFNVNVKGRKRQLLEAIGQACRRVYNDIELELGVLDEWDEIATKQARDNGIISAY